jgi:hypothetical protein
MRGGSICAGHVSMRLPGVDWEKAGEDGRGRGDPLPEVESWGCDLGPGRCVEKMWKTRARAPATVPQTPKFYHIYAQ